MKKKIVIYNPDSSSAVYLPLLWASAKSYYELKGKDPDRWEWIHPRINYQFDDDKIKEHLLEVQPDVFGISMYIWNDVQCLKIAKWVKETFPNCVVISGGPQQYFKHELDWFEQYPFLDASLDGGEYGEITFADLLDNLNDDNSIDWNTVTEVVFPSKSRNFYHKSKKRGNKSQFFWDYSPYTMQRETFLECANEVRQFTSPVSNVVNGKLETTRGCPYSCAFCDWGGGIASKVKQKSIEHVKADIDVLEEAGCAYIFLCDANFGILKERDIDIIQYMADRKQANPAFFHVYFGGFAKTDKHTEYIKQILDIDAQNNLTWDLSYKASIQSIHQDVLQNIARSDISFEKHVYLANHLKHNYGFSTYAECISGLPGITPDRWYHEMDVYASHDMDICLYNWHMLPETPSYSRDFRARYGIKTVKKYNNMQPNNITLRKSEVVVESFSYTKEEYKEMWIAFSAQRAFWTTGLLRKVLQKIFKKSNIGYGEFIKLFYRKFLRKNPGLSLQDHIQKIDNRFAEYYDDDNESANNLSIKFGEVVAPMETSFMLKLFYDYADCRDDIKKWLLEEFPYLTAAEIDRESDLFITAEKRYTSEFKKFKYVRFSNDVISPFKNDTITNLVDFLTTQMHTYTRTEFLRGRVIGI
jgi:putative methyltransferase